MRDTGKAARLGLLAIAIVLSAGILVAAAPEKTIEINQLGSAAVNTAPAIKISLAGKPAPAPVEKAEPKPVQKTKPEPKPKPKPKPKPEPKPAPTPEPEPEPEPETVAEPEASVTPEPALESGDSQSQSSVPLQNAGNPSAVDDYLGKLSRHLSRFYEYPRRARRLGQEGAPVITFTFRRDGSLVDHSLRTESGHSLLDKAALAMLEQAAPLPPVPDDMSGRTFSYALPVRFSLR
ncbi:energy transducer TonB [Marinobacter sp.]|uniref:energy transducer TonB n=1 Tax=Marinobacter sp. TaxID=50741 RepID=UPI001B6B5A17|nr:energy transducer TonB [Marinobacter sp.]MBQ0833605.1 energy transducer TonB [Marinobacter sp.]